jgi:hypothetical protein
MGACTHPEEPKRGKGRGQQLEVGMLQPVALALKLAAY